MKLYIIKCNEFYKIGITDDLKARIASLQTGNPYPLKVEYVFELGEDANKIEEMLHSFMEHCKVQGEWFGLDDADIGLILYFLLMETPLKKISDETLELFLKISKSLKSISIMTFRHVGDALLSDLTNCVQKDIY